MKKILAMVLALTLSTGFLASCGQAKIPDDVTITNMEEFEDNSVNEIYGILSNQLEAITKNDLEKYRKEANFDKLLEKELEEIDKTVWEEDQWINLEEARLKRVFEDNIALCGDEDLTIEEIALNETAQAGEGRRIITVTVKCGDKNLYGTYNYRIIDDEYAGAIVLSEKDPFAIEISFDGISHTLYNVFSEYAADMETKGYMLQDGEYKIEFGKTDYSNETIKGLAESAAEAAASDSYLKSADGCIVKIAVSRGSIEKVEISKTDNFANPDGAYAP